MINSLFQPIFSFPRSIEVASFTGGDSLMAVLTPADSVNRVELDLEFRTFADDGIILYSGSADGADADFLSVALVDGFVEFRYDLGSGAVSIRSPERVRPGHWHRIVAAR